MCVYDACVCVRYVCVMRYVCVCVMCVHDVMCVYDVGACCVCAV